MFESGGIYYRRKNDHLMIVGVAELIKSDIVVPNEINGCPIKEVDTCAFQNVNELDSISFSSTMEVIGEKAFYNCKNLKFVCFLGNNHQTVIIKNMAFAGCKNLEGINGGVNILLEGDHIFTRCYGLTKMPPQLRDNIPLGTFAGCRNLKILIFHNIKMVHQCAFLDCNNVEKAFILNDFSYTSDFIDCLKNATIVCKLDSKFAELAYDGYNIATLNAIKTYSA